MAVVVVPIYHSEIAPPELRGLFGSAIQGMIILGQVIAAVIAYGTQKLSSDAAWRVPIALQLVMPAIIFALLPFLPESPRWLLSKDRYDDAAQNLRSLRKNATEEEIDFELASLRHARTNEHKGGWAEVFDAKNRARCLRDTFVRRPLLTRPADPHRCCRVRHVRPAGELTSNLP